MSDTPETDLEELVQMGKDWTFVNADFACKLERERDEARKQTIVGWHEDEVPRYTQGPPTLERELKTVRAKLLWN